MVGRPRTRTVCHCGKPEQAKGLCARHYQQQRRPVHIRLTREVCEKCDQPHHAKGLCEYHYQQARREALSAAKLPCRKCGEPHYSKGLCRAHYFADRADGKLLNTCVICGKTVTRRGRARCRKCYIRSLRPPTMCTEPECGRDSVAKGLCRMHYLRVWRAAKRVPCVGGRPHLYRKTDTCEICGATR